MVESKYIMVEIELRWGSMTEFLKVSFRIKVSVLKYQQELLLAFPEQITRQVN